MTLAERALALVKIASVTGDEAAIADEVEAWAKLHYPAEQRVRLSHSFVLGRRADPRPTIALVGHLDTVPPHPDGNVARVEGDRLLGLGSSDMKGALAVMMALAEDLPRDTLKVNLLLVLYEREEGPFQQSGLGPLFERVPELKDVRLCIAMEPTDGAVQVGCVGSLQATLRFEGVAAHSARPWAGKNAIHAAGSLLTELGGKERKAVIVENHTFYEVMSATLAKGGRARNVVPDSFELNVNYRFAPGKSVAQATYDLEQFVAGRCSVTVNDQAPSGRLCGDNPFFQQLVRLTGRPAEAKQAWTDVARFSELGVDAVNFGPGETAQAHQRDESASVAALQHAYDTLKALLTAPR